MVLDCSPTPDAIRKQLKKTISSSDFRGSDKQKKFLCFIVAETLKNPDVYLKAFAVAVVRYMAETISLIPRLTLLSA